MAFDGIAADRIVAAADEFIRSLNSGRAKLAAQGMNVALEFYDEADPPAARSEWQPAQPPEEESFSSDQDLFRIAEYAVRNAGLPYDDEEGLPHHLLIHTHRYDGDFPVSILITAAGLSDADLDLVRYRVDFLRNDQGDSVIDFLGYQIMLTSPEPRRSMREGWQATEWPPK